MNKHLWVKEKKIKQKIMYESYPPYLNFPQSKLMPQLSSNP